MFIDNFGDEAGTRNGGVKVRPKVSEARSEEDPINRCVSRRLEAHRMGACVCDASRTNLPTGSFASRQRTSRCRSAEPADLPSSVALGVVECAVRPLDKCLNGPVGRFRNRDPDTARQRHRTLGGPDL